MSRRSTALWAFGLVALAGGCGADAIEESSENIFGLPATALTPDTAPIGSDSLSRRNAAARTSAGCGAILIAPRVVATAAHCASPGAVLFGPAFDQAAGVAQCTVEREALSDATFQANPRCDDPGLRFNNPRRTSHDWTILVLDRRVDSQRHQGTTIDATPAELATSSDVVDGTPLRWVGPRHVFVRQPDGTFALEIDPTAGRVFADVTFQSVGAEPTVPEFAGFGAFTHFGDAFTSEFLGVGLGDSGSPFYLGSPDDLIQPLRLVALTTSGHGTVPPGVDASLPAPDGGTAIWNPNVIGGLPAWDPDVASFLSPFVGCPDGCFVNIAPTTDDPVGRRVYVGLANRPFRGDPLRLAIDDGPDPDGDGLDDIGGYNLCPGIFDPDQRDSDGDGVGDACDSCPGAINPLQENCNADSEDTERAGDLLSVASSCTTDADCASTQYCAPSDWTGPADQRSCAGGVGCRCLTARRGDICDATPCGLTHPVAQPFSSAMTLEVDARSAVRAEDHGSTGFRVCPCVDAVRNDATARRACAASCPLDRVDEYHRALRPHETESTFWRFLSTTDRATSVRSLGGRYDLPYDPIATEGELFVDGTFDTSVTAVDIVRWRGDTRLRDSYPFPLVTGAPTNALVWTHTASFGVPTASTSISTCGDPGTACTASACEGTTECLIPSEWDSRIELVASDYWSGAVVPVPLIPSAVPCVHAIGPIVGDAACPACGGAFPEIYAGFVGQSFGLQCQDLGDVLGLLTGGGLAGPSLQIPIFDPPVFPDSDLRWVAAAEPTQWLPEIGARYIALDASGTPTALVLSEPGKLEVVSLGKLGCPNCVAPAAASAGTTTIANAAYVFSASRSTLYVVGGGVSFASFTSDTGWRSVATSQAVGRVLAATYAPYTRSLVVLDEQTVRHRSYARMLRVDPDSGHVVELARWERRIPGATLSLAAGPDGHVYVGASIGAVHVVLAVDGAGTPTGIVAGIGALASAPMHASELGLSVVVTSRSGGRAIGYTWASFHRETSMAEQCF